MIAGTGNLSASDNNGGSLTVVPEPGAPRALDSGDQ